MKPLAALMAGYAAYHRHPCNRFTHFIGVPAIVFSLLAVTSFARVSSEGGFEISLATAFVAAMSVYYVSLDLGLGLALLALLAPILWAANRTAQLDRETAIMVSALAFFGGWALQLLGHRIEGNRPALLDNLFHILVAPIFLVAEAAFAMGAKRGLQADVEQRLLMPDNGEHRA